MSALFLTRHRFSTINPDDIARVGGRRLTLNSISFKPYEEEEEDDEDDLYEDEESRKDGGGLDEEKRIGLDDTLIKRRRSTKTRPLDPRVAALRRMQRRWARWSHAYGFKHIIPIVLLFVYSIIGALVFSAVELPYAQAKRANTMYRLEANRRWVADSMIRELRLRNDSRSYDVMLEILGHSDVNNSLPAAEYITWNVWGALFYVGQVYTTIGYGNIYPETTLGYALTIVYSFFGVPLLLAILSDLGQLLAYYSSRCWRYLMSRVPDVRKKPKTLIEQVVPDSGVPISLCLVLTFGWLLMCSALFCLWEKNWTYFKAFYFFFISLSTIGLGDVVPEQPQLMIFNFWLVIIGLCLVSMTLGVVQEHIALFLYRMMIELQKECETMLANGEDVDKEDLVGRMWENQPWFVRKFMPAFVNEVEKQRLDDYAGAAITDTAVSMGLIPTPPNYRTQTVQLAPTFVQAPMMVHSPISIPAAVGGTGAHQAPVPARPVVSMPAAIVTAPLAMIPEAKIRPKEAQRQAEQQARAGPPVTASKITVRQTPLSSIAEALPTMQQPVAPEPQMEDLYPGGRVVLKRQLSGRVAPLVQPAVSHEDPHERLQRALRTRVATTQTADDLRPMRDSNDQTELLAKQVVSKDETLSTLSLASWNDDDDASTIPFNFGQLQKLTADDLKNIPGIDELLASRFPMFNVQRKETYVQTDDHPEAISLSSSSSDEEYVSAVETRSLLATPNYRFVNKFVQTAPIARWPSDVPMVNAEVQTSTSNRVSAEVQTRALQREDTEVQCQPLATDDEEAQTSTTPSQTNPFAQPDLLPRHWSQDTLVDRASQTVFTLERDEKEVQTMPARARNSETQTEVQLVPESVETQTDGARGLRLKSSTSDDDTTDEYETASSKPQQLPGGWSYNSWIASRDRERMNSLLSVPEEMDDEEFEEADEDVDDEEDDDELDDIALMEDEENTDQQDVHGFTEEDDTATSEGGVVLPPITKPYDDERTVDEAMSMRDEEGKQRRGSRKSRLSWADQLRTHIVITAAIATQTEEMIFRRQSFPRDQFTSKIKDPKLVFVKEEETSGGDRSHSHGLISWIRGKRGGTRAKEPSLSEKSDSKQAQVHQQLSMHTQDTGVQTDYVPLVNEDTREIMIQTDESYLMKAKKFENLRQNRTKSLAVAVAPHLKQRLAQAAATQAAAKAEASSTTTPSKTGPSTSEVRPKKITPPKRR